MAEGSYGIVNELIDDLRKTTKAEFNLGFDFVRKHVEKVEKWHSEEVDELKGLLEQIYSIMLQEPPSDGRTKVMGLISERIFKCPE